MAVHASSEFKGIGFEYDPTAQPMFKALCKEALRKLALLPTGQEILKLVKNARPAHRRQGLASKVNVVLRPPADRLFLIPGMRKNGTVADQAKVDAWNAGTFGVKLIPTLSAKTSVGADCGKGQGAAKFERPNGTATGSTCYVEYSNTEILSDAGLWAIPYITMGHELIHCVHALYGQSKWDDKEEEWFTVGIKGFEGASVTENKLRAEGKHPRRTKYFKDD